MEEPAAARSDLRNHPLYVTMLAGGLGGGFGDFLVHSIDTVKVRRRPATCDVPLRRCAAVPNAETRRAQTRLQAHGGGRYTSSVHAFATIMREEGLVRGTAQRPLRRTPAATARIG